MQKSLLRRLLNSIKPLALSIAIATATAQTTQLISPIQVTNIETVLKGSGLWVEGSKMVALTQANGVWAALVQHAAKPSAVIFGDRDSEFAFTAAGDFDDIKLDVNQNPPECAMAPQRLRGESK